MDRRHTHRHAGFNMAEITIALMVLSVGLISVVGFFPQGLVVQKRSQDQTIGANIASRIFARLESGTSAGDAIRSAENTTSKPVEDLIGSKIGFAEAPKPKFAEVAKGKYLVEIQREDSDLDMDLWRIRVYLPTDDPDKTEGDPVEYYQKMICKRPQP